MLLHLGDLVAKFCTSCGMACMLKAVYWSVSHSFPARTTAVYAVSARAMVDLGNTHCCCRNTLYWSTYELLPDMVRYGMEGGAKYRSRRRETCQKSQGREGRAAKEKNLVFEVSGSAERWGWTYMYAQPRPSGTLPCGRIGPARLWCDGRPRNAQSDGEGKMVVGKKDGNWGGSGSS